MRNGLRAAAMAILSLATAGAVGAQPAPVAVDVQLGPAVQARVNELGRTDLDQQRQYLQKDVLAALRRSRTPPAEVHLSIADIEPNRPTSAQLGMSTQLRESSFGTGGAAVTGDIVTADGRHIPVRYRFFQDQIRNEVNFTTWGDADQAFDEVAAAIAAGRPPNDSGVWPPPHRARAVTGTRIPG